MDSISASLSSEKSLRIFSAVRIADATPIADASRVRFDVYIYPKYTYILDFSTYSRSSVMYTLESTV